MKCDDLIAIDVHTHTEVSCRQQIDPVWQTYEDAASKYFKAATRPTIAETIAYYRAQKIGPVMFPVDSEHEPDDRVAYGVYELIAANKFPAIFDSGHSGIGTGMPGGGGLLL